MALDEAQLIHLANQLTTYLDLGKTQQSWRIFQGIYWAVYHLTWEGCFHLIMSSLCSIYSTGPYSEEFDTLITNGFSYLAQHRPDVWSQCQQLMNQVRQEWLFCHHSLPVINAGNNGEISICSCLNFPPSEDYPGTEGSATQICCKKDSSYSGLWDMLYSSLCQQCCVVSVGSTATKIPFYCSVYNLPITSTKNFLKDKTSSVSVLKWVF